MRKYLIILEKSDTGYGCYAPDLPGCVASGPTKEIAEQNMYEAIQFHLEGMEMEGLAIPEPKTESELFVFA